MPESPYNKAKGKVSFSFSHSTIDEIGKYYEDCESGLEAFYLTLCPEDRFIGYSKSELEKELKEKKAILDRTCSLELLAALEARFRIDYLIRCQNKHKDVLSRKFREIHQQKANRASLTDDILTAWRSLFPEHKTRLDDFQKAIDYRNWLAHGRYWLPKRTPHINSADYLTIYLLTDNILANMMLLES
ncbi:hypothetical protein [Salinisphaera sp. G21_0]|uniref:hypothetical protein n=1 Tax=Salinisphaera sp. G21_0 TaxID=2821094 RepID=UPI001ADAD96F|nr:hypothetical protein [Salinisphaera sp. G21_0]MBO9483106.1 hypothetical protein [Salinisphaera sp. G21_0]